VKAGESHQFHASSSSLFKFTVSLLMFDTPIALTGVGLEGTTRDWVCAFSSSSSSSSSDLLLEEVAGGRDPGDITGGINETGGVPAGRDINLGFCALKGSFNGGAKVLMKDAETSERIRDALLDPFTNLWGVRQYQRQLFPIIAWRHMTVRRPRTHVSPR